MEVPNTYFDLFLGYTVIWGILAVCVLRTLRSQLVVQREVEALKQQIDAAADGTSERLRVNQ